MKAWIIAAACCAAATAWAGEYCASARTEFETMACLHRVYQTAEQGLSARYQELVSLLDADGRKRLRVSQLAWLKSRNASCSQRKGTSTMVDPRCMAEVTTARAQSLQERIGECRAGGCLNERL